MTLAALAEEAGAEAVAVDVADVERVRASTSLAVLVRGGDPTQASASGADAWIVPFSDGAEAGSRTRPRAGSGLCGRGA